MFKLDVELLEKLKNAFTLDPILAVAGPQIHYVCAGCTAACAQNCTSGCKGSCKGGCTRSCKGNSR